MIEIKNLCKAFGPKVVLDSLNLSVKKGEFLAIVGRSGEGKSVLLKNIIGLLRPDSGTIVVDGTDITQLSDEELQSLFKKCGYVFQFAALLDSLTVFENIGITMLEENADPNKVRTLVLEKTQSVGLRDDVLDKYPDELSGGMKKRVGLARTLMLDPHPLLYDEPTTGLDPITVRLIHELIVETHKRQAATSVVISHDPNIFEYADRVAMLYEGKIIYEGAAKDIWESDHPHIYQFIRGLAEGPITAEQKKAEAS